MTRKKPPKIAREGGTAKNPRAAWPLEPRELYVGTPSHIVEWRHMSNFMDAMEGSAPSDFRDLVIRMQERTAYDDDAVFWLLEQEPRYLGSAGVIERVRYWQGQVTGRGVGQKERQAARERLRRIGDCLLPPRTSGPPAKIKGPDLWFTIYSWVRPILRQFARKKTTRLRLKARAALLKKLAGVKGEKAEVDTALDQVVWRPSAHDGDQGDNSARTARALLQTVLKRLTGEFIDDSVIEKAISVGARHARARRTGRAGPAQEMTSALSPGVDGALDDEWPTSATVKTASAKDINQFTIRGVGCTINETNISLTLPAGTKPTCLTPNIFFTGASVSPASGIAQDFTNPVLYTV